MRKKLEILTAAVFLLIPLSVFPIQNKEQNLKQLKLAQAYEKLGEYERALEIYKMLYVKEPTNPNYFLGYEKSMQNLKMFDELVAHYNKMVSAVKNKARVLFSATARLIQEAFDNYGGDDLQIIVDRQGGRVRYRKTLGQMFPGMELEIIRQSKNLSSYELRADGKKMRLHFTVAADKRFFPVSLASMVSKYQRELLVDNINHYFTAFHADLKPTAGYWKDGLRFIDDLKNNIPDIEVDNNQLIRCR